MSHIAISIVNYKTADLTASCLASLLLARQYVECEGHTTAVFVVDNASGDDSVEILAKLQKELDFHLVQSDKNGGFGYGHNLMFELSRQRATLGFKPADFFVMLNPDTTIPENSLYQLLTYMQQHPGCGLGGGNETNMRGESAMSAQKFPSFLTELKRGLGTSILRRFTEYGSTPPQCVDWVSGAYMMARGPAFEQVGGFDEKYFLYFEEIDLMQRLHAAHWTIGYCPSACVQHVGGASTQIGQIKRIPKYWFDSRRRYLSTHLSRPHAVITDLAYPITALAKNAIRMLLGKEVKPLPPNLLEDYVRNSIWMN